MLIAAATPTSVGKLRVSIHHKRVEGDCAAGLRWPGSGRSTSTTTTSTPRTSNGYVLQYSVNPVPRPRVAEDNYWKVSAVRRSASCSAVTGPVDRRQRNLVNGRRPTSSPPTTRQLQEAKTTVNWTPDPHGRSRDLGEEPSYELADRPGPGPVLGRGKRSEAIPRRVSRRAVRVGVQFTVVFSFLSWRRCRRRRVGRRPLTRLPLPAIDPVPSPLNSLLTF